MDLVERFETGANTRHSPFPSPIRPFRTSLRVWIESPAVSTVRRARTIIWVGRENAKDSAPLVCIAAGVSPASKKKEH